MRRFSTPVRAAAMAGVLVSWGLLAAPARGDDAKLIKDAAKTLAKDKDPLKRVDAAEMLGRFKSPEAVPPLAAALADPSANVREAAAAALWKVSSVAEPARPALQKALADSDPAVAITAAGALEAMGVPETELKPAFERVLAEARGSRERFLAARGLIGLVPGPRVLPAILDYLKQQETSENRAFRNVDIARKALAQLVDTEDAALDAALLNMLAGGDAVVRKAILRARHDEEYATRLLPGLARLATEDPDNDVKEAALHLANQLPSPPRDLLKAVEKAMKDPDEGVRRTAAMVLNQAQGRALHDQLSSAKGIDEVKAVLKAAESGGPAAGLAATLRTGTSEPERSQAAQALGQMNMAVDVAAPALAEAVLKDPSAKVRFQAASALAGLANAHDSKMAVLRTLLQALKVDQGPSTRVEIYRALWKHARHSPEAAALVVPVLEAALQDPEDGVREQAKEGLTWLKR